MTFQNSARRQTEVDGKLAAAAAAVRAALLRDAAVEICEVSVREHAAGGPILVPSQRSMALTPICAHSLTNRPLVVGGRSKVRMQLGGDSRGVVLTVDGQWGHSFLPGDVVEITAAAQPLRLFESGKRYFDILREKLHWGARSDRDR